MARIVGSAPKRIPSGEGKTIAPVKPRRRDPQGRKILRQIRRAQSKVELTMQYMPTRRVVVAIMNEGREKPMRIQKSAVKLIQLMAEELVTGLMRVGNRVAVDNKRKTLKKTDFVFAKEIMLTTPSMEQQQHI